MGAHTNVVKSCITHEKFDKGNFMMTDKDAETCKQTVSTNTPTSLDAELRARANAPGPDSWPVDRLSRGASRRVRGRRWRHSLRRGPLPDVSGSAIS
jgi:Protein of unknown function (DUF3617)